MTKKFKLKNLDCADCAAKMERKINQMDGVEEARVNFMFSRLTLTAADSVFDRVSEQVASLIKEIEPDCTMVF